MVTSNLWKLVIHSQERSVENAKVMIKYAKGTELEGRFDEYLVFCEEELEKLKGLDLVKCDNCTKEIFMKDTYPVFDENFKRQDGLVQCEECFSNPV